MGNLKKKLKGFKKNFRSSTEYENPIHKLKLDCFVCQEFTLTLQLCFF